MIGLGKKYGADALNKLKQTIYTSSTLQVINEIQDKYHVSAAFMLAVSDYATKLGTVNNNIVKVGYNLFKYPGTSKDIVVTVDGKIFKAYSSYGASFTDFARLMAEGASYFKAGNINISQISKIYAPSSSDAWANDIATRVSEIMNYKKYDALSSSGLEVHFINPNSRVDAIYVKAGDKSLFIDGGFYRDAKAEMNYLNKIGVKHIDYYIGTHAHRDHVPAASPIIYGYGIDTLITNASTFGNSNAVKKTILEGIKDEKDKNLRTKLTSAVNACKVAVFKPGNTLEFNNLKITCLGPIKIKKVSSASDVGENYNSLILRFDYGSTSFLMAGDGMASEFNDTIKKYPNAIDVDVYKNSHHNGQMSDSVLKKITPKYVVFATKDGYLPSSSYLNKLKKMGAKTYIVTNKKDGNVVLFSDGTNITVKTKQ